MHSIMNTALEYYKHIAQVIALQKNKLTFSKDLKHFCHKKKLQYVEISNFNQPYTVYFKVFFHLLFYSILFFLN